MGEMFLTDIRGVDVQKFYNDLVKDGYALSSIKVASAVLNGCLRQAMRNGLIEQNPVRLAELPRQKEKKTRIAMTKEQQALFMEYAKESYLYNFFAVMLRTGLRRGEMQGLKYSDVDKKNMYCMYDGRKADRGARLHRRYTKDQNIEKRYPIDG